MAHPLLDPAAAPLEHRSLNSRLPTVVAFENATQRTVEVIWLNYQGTAHRYHALLPGASAVQPTFTTHPWVFRDAADHSAMLVVEGQAVFYAPPLMRGSPCSQVVIREASRQPWSPAHHLLTPPAFQQQVATLLLCHWRLARSGAPPQGRAAQERAASAGWRERLRSAMLWPCRLPDLERRGQQAEHAGPKEEEAGLLPAAQHQLGLGNLPQELVLKIIASAAPSIPLVAKPALPQGVSPAELLPEALEQLFRAGVHGGAAGSPPGGSSSEGGEAGLWQAVPGEEQERYMPSHQLWQLRIQQEDPQPPPLAAVPHPFQGYQLPHLAAGAGANPQPADPAPGQHGNGAVGGHHPV